MIAVRLDRVFTFGDQLSFLIPHDWVEADEEADHYLYHAPNADSGWLRVSLITLKDSGTSSQERLQEVLEERAKKEHGELYESGENIVVAWTQISQENGVPICNYWWAVGHSQGPSLAYEALFSYTVLRRSIDDSKTRGTVAMLSKLLADAKFAEPKLV